MALATEPLFALASLLLGAVALQGATSAWRLQSQPVDSAMRVLAFWWILFVVVSLTGLFAPRQWAAFSTFSDLIANVIFVGLLGSFSCFLLVASRAARPWNLSVVTLQVLGGLVVSIWFSIDKLSSPLVLLVSTALNLIGTAVVTISVTQQVRQSHSRRSWLVLAACAMGVGLWLNQATAPGDVHRDLPVGLHMYALFIFVVWKLVSLNPDADKQLASLYDQTVTRSSLQTLSSISSDDDFVALALRAERQRISYELHDNIGSQLTNILFSIKAAQQPQKQLVLMSLEQCLADLKMTVDSMDTFDENVGQALGRLRYRVQPALDRQSTLMHWDVEISAELEAVQGVYAQQVLRIAQESISNVMRHAKANSVRVSCRFVGETGHLLLEVHDDGIGNVSAKNKRITGRGLDGMKRRAAAVGGFLQISNPSGGGTLVHLILPLPHVKQRRNSAEPLDAASRFAA